MKKKLKRDEEEAVVSGVLAGLAKYWNQDPVLFRVLAIAFLVLTGFFPGILLYLGAWFVMPSDNRTNVDYEIVD
jgi:phage shock protein C